MDYGFFRAAAASLKLKVADPEYNKKEIIKAIDDACVSGVRLLVTPELSVTGYTCADLFFTSALRQASDKALFDLAEYTAGKNICVIVGVPIAACGKLYNCAAVLFDGRVQMLTPKQNIANYNEFYEKRWFASGENICGVYLDKYGCEIGGSCVIELCEGVRLGIELCEDLWVPEPPSGALALSGANIIANLSASDEYVSKAQYRRSLIENQSARCICAYVYAGASVHESTTDLVFSGATVIAENGTVIAEGERFSRDNVLTVADIDYEKLNTLREKNMSFCGEQDFDIDGDCVNIKNDNDLKYRHVDAYPFVPRDDSDRRERCREIFSIQAAGLAKRLEHVGSSGAVIGISGGLDSTLALLVCTQALKLLGRDNADILAITMPGFGTTDRTHTNAVRLINALGAQYCEIDISDACRGHMRDIGHDENIKDITYENTQARERTQILFDMANKHSKLLVGTGDLSELAMGWCTYNGDHMSMYGVNASVPKTLVRYLVQYVADISGGEIADILYDILDTPVSPELLPPDESGKIAQKTEENIGSYELHDFFLYNFVRFGYSKEKLKVLALKAFDGKYGESEIEKWLGVFFKRFFISQFKRSCIPDSPKVGSVSLSPRGDWRMPSDASFNCFI